jgi:putative transposase
LNLDGMKRLWGRKVSDLGFAEFVDILQQAAAKSGTAIEQVDQWLPSSKACARCGTLREMLLSERQYHCPQCGWRCSRDQNAALNIVAAGASAAGLGDVRRPLLAAVSA